MRFVPHVTLFIWYGNLLRQGGEGVAVLGEGFGGFAAALETTEVFHRCMPVVHFVHVLAHVAVAGLVFAFQHALDVDPMGGMEHLALGARHGFKIE